MCSNPLALGPLMGIATDDVHCSPVLPIKFKDSGKWLIGLLTYYPLSDNQELDQDFVLHKHHGIIALSPKKVKELNRDLSAVKSAKECIDILSSMEFCRGVKLKFKKSELGFKLSRKDRQIIIDQLGNKDPEGLKNTVLFT